MTKYEIFYPNQNVKQIKNLIDHSEYEVSKTIFSKLDPSHKKYNEDTYNLRKKYLEQFGNFFTTKSPLAKAMKNLLLQCNGQEILVLFRKV